jgi:tetratricopeptide (TPR) repeat protein
MSTQDIAPLLNEGEARLSAEDWDGAVAVLRQAVAAQPSSAVARSKLGIAYAHRREWEAARAEFLRAIELDPAYAPAHSNLGNVYREQGRPEEAIASYRKALALDPEYWIAHQNLAVVYKEQGRIDEAVRESRISARLSIRAGRIDRTGAMGVDRPGVRLGCLGTGGSAAALLFAALAMLRR